VLLSGRIPRLYIHIATLFRWQIYYDYRYFSKILAISPRPSINTIPQIISNAIRIQSMLLLLEPELKTERAAGTVGVGVGINIGAFTPSSSSGSYGGASVFVGTGLAVGAGVDTGVAAGVDIGVAAGVDVGAAVAVGSGVGGE